MLEIESFLDDLKTRRNSVLRIAAMANEKLCAKILTYDKELDLITMWTMYPKAQQGESPMKCFSTEPFRRKDKDVIAVWLKNVPNPSIPVREENLSDEQLYSYRQE